MVMMKDALADAAATGAAAASSGTEGAAPTGGSGEVSARDIAEILADVIDPNPIPAGRRLPVVQ
jgi:uncharacterized protein YbjT (DUF2867 family)